VFDNIYGIGVIISNMISSPLFKLTNSVNEITKGNLDVQLKKSHISEINNLVGSLNRILASLKLAILKVGIKKEDLEPGETDKLKKKATGIKSKLNAILKSIPYGIDIIDKNLNILWMNDKFEKLFGKDAIGKKYYQIYKDNKKHCMVCPLKKPIKLDETKKLFTSGVCGGKTFEITHKR